MRVLKHCVARVCGVHQNQPKTTYTEPANLRAMFISHHSPKKKIGSSDRIATILSGTALSSGLSTVKGQACGDFLTLFKIFFSPLATERCPSRKETIQKSLPPNPHSDTNPHSRGAPTRGLHRTHKPSACGILCDTRALVAVITSSRST